MLKNLLVFAFCMIANSASAQVDLGSYNVNPNTVTVAGVSSGGAMAVQLQVAYSKRIFGTAVFAGITYFCARNTSAFVEICLTGIGIPVSALVTITNEGAASGWIDPVSNIGGKPIYIFSGRKDQKVYPPAMDDLYDYYQSFTNKGSITYNNTTDAAHAWVTPDGANACDHFGSPYLNNCAIDPQETFLTMFYGTLNPRHSGTLGGNYIQFNQNKFCPNDDCSSISMDSTAWVFVPQSCAQQQACRLVIALHGCLQNQQTPGVGNSFIQKSGINEWADGNNIIVLYPQTISGNFDGCWDWFGYTGPNYAVRTAPQMIAIMAEVKQITGGN